MYLGSLVIYKCFGLGYVPKVGLLAIRPRFAYRTNIVTILLRYLFSLAFQWKKLCLCVAQSEYVYNEYENEFMRIWVRVKLCLRVELRVVFGGRQYGHHTAMGRRTEAWRRRCRSQLPSLRQQNMWSRQRIGKNWCIVSHTGLQCWVNLNDNESTPSHIRILMLDWLQASEWLNTKSNPYWYAIDESY